MPNQCVKLSTKGFTRTLLKTGDEVALERKERQQRRKEEEERAHASARAAAPSVDSDSSDDSSMGSSDDDMSFSSDYGKKPAAKGTALLALPPSDYRIDRCHLSKDLQDAADEDEKACQAAEDLLPKDSHCEDRENLEDHRGMYRRLGSDLSKKSSQAEVDKAISDTKKEWRESALRTHSDKTADPHLHREFLDAKDVYRRKEEAFFLGNKDESGGCAKRVKYDNQGEQFRAEWKIQFFEAYPEYTFSKRVGEIAEAQKRQEIYAKGMKTRDESQDLSGMKKIHKLWKANGQQDMYCKVAIWETLSGANGQKKYKVADIARYLRLHVYTSPKIEALGWKS